jgi:hypothetical protein
VSTACARSSGCVTGHALRRGRRTQRGQALVEFTFFFTFVMMPMVVGVTDISALLDDNVNLVYAARQGARTGAVIGPVAGADCEIVGAIHSTLLNQPDVTLTKITIFQVGHDGSVLGGLLTPTHEEVYQGSDYCDSTGKFVTPGDPTTDTWPADPAAASCVSDPTTCRNVTPFFEDTIGIRLDFTYSWRFNVLGFATFSGYDIAEYPMNPSGEPTPLPQPTPTCGGGVVNTSRGAAMPVVVPTACV